MVARRVRVVRVTLNTGFASQRASWLGCTTRLTTGSSWQGGNDCRSSQAAARYPTTAGRGRLLLSVRAPSRSGQRHGVNAGGSTPGSRSENREQTDPPDAYRRHVRAGQYRDTLPGDIGSDTYASALTVRLDRFFSEAAASRCEICWRLTATGTAYPGTDLRRRYEITNCGTTPREPPCLAIRRNCDLGPRLSGTAHPGQHEGSAGEAKRIVAKSSAPISVLFAKHSFGRPRRVDAIRAVSYVSVLWRSLCDTGVSGSLQFAQAMTDGTVDDGVVPKA